MTKHVNTRAVVLAVHHGGPPRLRRVRAVDVDPDLLRYVRGGAQVQARDLRAAPVRMIRDVGLVVSGHEAGGAVGGGVPPVPVPARLEVVRAAEVEAYRRLVDPCFVGARVREVTGGDVGNVIPVPCQVQRRAPGDDHRPSDGVSGARLVVLERRRRVERPASDEERLLGPRRPRVLLPRVGGFV